MSRKKSFIATITAILIIFVSCLAVGFSFLFVSAETASPKSTFTAGENVTLKDKQKDAKTNKNALLISSSQQGASAEFNMELIGEFTAETRNFGDSTTAYSLCFEDVSTKNSFSVVMLINNGETDVCVEYEGQRAAVYYYNNNSYGYSSIFNRQGKYTSVGSGSVKIKFDPVNMRVYAGSDANYKLVWDFGRTYNDGKELINDLSGFGEYKVSVVIDGVKEKSIGGVYVFSFAGYDMTKDALSDAPVLRVQATHSAVVDEEYALPTPVISKIGESLSASDITVTVKNVYGMEFYNGSAVGAKFTPTAEEEYLIVYSYVNGSNRAECELTVSALYKECVVTAFEFENELPDTVALNMPVLITACNVESNLSLNGMGVKAQVAIKKGGVVIDNIISGEEYTFDSEGEYELEYSASKLGIVETKSVTLNVSRSYKGVKVDKADPVVALGSLVELAEPTIYLNNTSQNGTVKVTYPSGKQSAGSFVANEIGLYTINYYLGNEICEYSQTFKAEELKETFFTADGGNVAYSSLSLNDEIKGALLTLENNKTITYNKVIDLSDNTFDDSVTPEEKLKADPLLQLYVLPLAMGDRAMEGLYITFTDIYDSSNYITIRLRYNPYVQDTAYVRTKAVKGITEQNWVGLNYNYNTCERRVDQMSDSEYNGYQTKASFIHNLDSNIGLYENSFYLYYDFAETAMYSRPLLLRGAANNAPRPWLIRDYDADDPEILDGVKWMGFTTGEVYVSFSGYGIANTAQVLLLSLDGEDFSQRYSSDNAGPQIEVDNFEGDIPSAVVGKEYRLLDCNITDNGSSVVSVVKSVSFGSEKIDVMPNGSFIPTRTGVYTVCYEATDSFGNSTIYTYNVNAVQNSEKPSISVEGIPSEVSYGDTLVLPRATVYSAGVGGLNVNAYVYDGEGNELEVVNGRIKCLYNGKVTGQTGTIVVKFVATDYIGQKAELVFDIKVNVDGKMSFDENTISLPYAFIDGEEYVFDRYFATCYMGDKDKNTAINAAISVQYAGKTVNIGADNTFVPAYVEGNNTATVVIAFKNGDELLSFTNDVQVVKIEPKKNGVMPSLMITDNAAVSANDNIMFTALSDGDMTLSFVRELYSESFNILFSIDMLAEESEVVINLRGIRNNDEAIEVSFTKTVNAKGEIRYYASVNGGAKKPVNVSNKSIGFSYKANNFELQDVKGSTFDKVTSYKNGSEFKGFADKKVYLNISVKDVKQGETFVLENINGQILNIMRDVYAPNIYLNGTLSGMVVNGATIEIPSAYAMDIISSVGDVTVTVYDPEGKVLYKDVNANESFSIVGEVIGKYRFVYSVKDVAGNSAKLEKNITVYNPTDPELKFDKNIVSSVKVGSTYRLPGYTVIDEINGADGVEVRIYVCTPDGLYKKVTDGQVTFGEAGVYYLEYFLLSDTGNTNLYSFEIICGYEEAK